MIMTQFKINPLTTATFDKIRNSFCTELDSSRGFDNNKEYILNDLPREIIGESNDLLDSLENLLIVEKREQLDSQSIDIRLAYEKYGFRDFMQGWKVDHPISILKKDINVSTDPRKQNGYIAGGTMVTVGAIAIFFVFPGISLGSVLASVATLGIGYGAYKIAYNSSTEKAKEVFKKDITEFVEYNRIQTSDWLKSAEKAFNEEFNKFCTNNNINL
jgi:hypothetical protein